MLSAAAAVAGDAAVGGNFSFLFFSFFFGSLLFWYLSLSGLGVVSLPFWFGRSQQLLSVDGFAGGSRHRRR